jgi:hypothetical protein
MASVNVTVVPSAVIRAIVTIARAPSSTVWVPRCPFRSVAVRGRNWRCCAWSDSRRSAADRHAAMPPRRPVPSHRGGWRRNPVANRHVVPTANRPIGAAAARPARFSHFGLSESYTR